MTQVEDHLYAALRVDVVYCQVPCVFGDEAVAEGYPPCWRINGPVTRL